MADKKLSQESSLTKATVATNDLIYIADVSANATKSMTYQEMMQPTDANFRIAGSSDNTKLVAFEVDGLTTATTRTVTIPDADTTMVGTGLTQTLTNKTLSTGTTFNGYNNAVVITDASGVASALTGTSGQIVSFDTSNVPVAIANPSASDGSTTVKGVFEANTQAEADAGTGTPDTSATLIPTTATIRARNINAYVADTGSSTAYAIAPTPAHTAYSAGQQFTFKATNANTTTTPTLNVNSLGAKTIVNPDGTALSVGQIPASAIVHVTYDGTNMQLTSVGTVLPISDVPNTNVSANSWYTFTLPISAVLQTGPTEVLDGWLCTANVSQTITDTYRGGAGIFGFSASGAANFSNTLPGTGTNVEYTVSANKAVKIKFRFKDGSGGAGRVGFGLTPSGTPADIYDTNSATVNTARFLISTSTLYAVTATGAANTNTDISSGITTSSWHTYEIFFTPGTDCKFYVDGVLKATHTTNLPASGTGILAFGVSAATTHYISPITIGIEI